MGKIKRLFARQVIDSRGNPTIEVELHSTSGVSRAIVPSGASTGSHEALELRDNLGAYGGKSVIKAVNNVNGRIAKNLIGTNPERQEDIDRLLIELDGTPNKSKLGANAILGVSMAACRAGALESNKPLYLHIQKISESGKIILPVPAMNIINGGMHAGNNLDIQEFMILPVGARTFAEALQMSAETYHILKGIIKEKYGKNATNVGDEGGFAPPLRHTIEAVQLIESAIIRAGYSGRIKIGMDCAASEFYKKFEYVYEGKRMDPHHLLYAYENLAAKHDIISIEDPFHEDDFESFAEINKKLSGKVQIVGDDLLVTNIERLKIAVKHKSCSALLLKVNQIGSVTEAIEAANFARKNGMNVMVSHRSGETEDTFIADLVTGLGTGQLKSGAPCRGERTAKYNQLLRIEEELGSKAAYGGTLK